MCGSRDTLMVLIGEKTNMIDHWRNSDQEHGWLAALLLDIEVRLRRIKSCRYFSYLRKDLEKEIEKGTLKRDTSGAAEGD